jgi:hypothetical protein
MFQNVEGISMISFYRVRGDFVRIPREQMLYLTEGQRQRESYLKWEGCDYREPGWHGGATYEGVIVGWGELFGLKGTANEELSKDLELQWVVEERQVLSYPGDAVGLKWDQLRELSGQAFEEVTGLSFSEFHQATTRLTRALWEKQRRGGRKEKQEVEDCLYTTLLYRQGKGSYQTLAKRYGLSVSRFYEMIQWVEKVLN